MIVGDCLEGIRPWRMDDSSTVQRFSAETASRDAVSIARNGHELFAVQLKE